MHALTAQGRRTLNAVDAFAARQARTALAGLARDQQLAVVPGLATCASALAHHSPADTTLSAQPVVIAHGYRPGIIGRVTGMHATFYAHLRLGECFERHVATGMSEFAARPAHRGNALWAALQQANRNIGSVAIEGKDLGKGTAHLRWFIVDDGLRGIGVGARHLVSAIKFCEQQQFRAIHLWTFEDLDPARHLHENAGFTLAEQRPGRQ